jgi:hypothetical protein
LRAVLTERFKPQDQLELIVEQHLSTGGLLDTTRHELAVESIRHVIVDSRTSQQLHARRHHCAARGASRTDAQ